MADRTNFCPSCKDYADHISALHAEIRERALEYLACNGQLMDAIAAKDVEVEKLKVAVSYWQEMYHDLAGTDDT